MTLHRHHPLDLLLRQALPF